MIAAKNHSWANKRINFLDSARNAWSKIKPRELAHGTGPRPLRPEPGWSSCALGFRGTSLRGKSPSTKIKCLESRALDWVGSSSIHGEDGQFRTALAFTGWRLLLAILKLCDLPDSAHLVRSSPVTQWSLIWPQSTKNHNHLNFYTIV